MLFSEHLWTTASGFSMKSGVILPLSPFYLYFFWWNWSGKNFFRFLTKVLEIILVSRFNKDTGPHLRINLLRWSFFFSNSLIVRYFWETASLRNLTFAFLIEHISIFLVSIIPEYFTEFWHTLHYQDSFIHHYHCTKKWKILNGKLHFLCSVHTSFSVTFFVAKIFP